MRRILFAPVFALIIAVLTAPSASASQDFYQPPADLSGEFGSLLKAEDSRFYVDPLKAVRAQARSQRLMYISSDPHGNKIAVSGTLLTPTRAWSGSRERPLVAFAVGTQGMATRCAPSEQLAAGSSYEGLLIAGLLARGYQVVVTDYQGLGVDGVHPYVNKIALGRNVLDSVRAAQRVATDATPQSAPVYITGYSEGGNAAAGALEQLGSYAPELNVKAGFVGAVPASLPEVASNLDGHYAAAFKYYAAKMVLEYYPETGLANALSAAGADVIERASQTCLIDGLAQFKFIRSNSLMANGKPSRETFSQPSFAPMFNELRVGTVKTTVPVVVVHSRLDDIVPYNQGRQMARDWCRLGSPVRFETLVTPTHVAGAAAAYPRALAFIESQQAGRSFSSNCGWF